jgi:hypothetical protein
VHPTSGGFAKMADGWYPAVVAALGTTPSPTAAPLRGVGSNRCLDVPRASTANGTQVTIWDCNGRPNQAWTLTAAKQLQVYGTKCLDGATGGDSPGDRVQILDCTGATNQQWNVASNGTVTSVKSGLCLDVAGAGTANGTVVNLWTCNGGSNQRWTRG